MTGATILHLPTNGKSARGPGTRFVFHSVVDGICAMGWDELDGGDVMRVAKAYYYFSIQFRENLEIACARHPEDSKLAELHAGECDTDNLSPWPAVSAAGERMNHDEFMRRLLRFHPAGSDRRLSELGAAYLEKVRSVDDAARAASIASYEDGGLSRVFDAILRAPDWQGNGQQAFRFFLEQHIAFDSEDGAGHGSLSRHLTPGDAILPLWTAFRDLLAAAVPRLATVAAVTRRGARTPIFLRPLRMV